MTLPRPRVAFGLALLGAVLAVTLTADAQPRVAVTTTAVGPGGKKGKEKDDRDWNEAIFLPVEREAKNKIDAVNKYLQGKEGTITPKLWEDIISVLQGLLDDPADKFVEIDGKGNKVSVKKEVNRIIGTFNDDGRQFYQRIVGPTADQKFKQAVDENDMLLMAEVSTRYLHTKAGADATVRIGTWHLDRGRYAQAANAFRLFLHAAAYNLVNFFRLQLPLPWRSAQVETLRAKLFKIGARVRHTARCIRFHLATGWPFQNLFRDVAFAVNST